MKNKKGIEMFKHLLAAFMSVFFISCPAYAGPAKSRSFEFDYDVVIKDIPDDASVIKIWLPQAPQTPYQYIKEVSVYPLNFTVTYDKSFHNKILYYRFKSPKSPIKIFISYEVKRYEQSGNVSGGLNKTIKTNEELGKYILSNRLMIVSPEIKGMAEAIVKDKKTVREKARAIYDYVFENVSYDKTVPGWGEGDTLRVCIIKAGNCTDFHSLFVSLARSIGIPADFVIGFHVPEEKSGEIQSYHCWAEFYDPESGWVPVDISEAWKDKAKKDYYFGNLDAGRIEFTRGRDLLLEPAANSGPLNYFIYPYVEVNGEKFNNVKTVFRFKEKTEKEE